jgi:hypothetical protein
MDPTCSEGVVEDNADAGTKLAECAAEAAAPGAWDERVWSDAASPDAVAELGRSGGKAGSADLSTRCF